MLRAMAPEGTALAAERKARVLVVDDHQDGADSLVRLLVMLGSEAKALYAAADLVAEALPFSPHIIFIDTLMPGVPGFQAARNVRRVPALDDAWLVSLSGTHNAETVRQAMVAGFDACYLKPINLQALAAVLALRSKKRYEVDFVIDPRLRLKLRP